MKSKESLTFAALFLTLFLTPAGSGASPAASSAISGSTGYNDLKGSLTAKYGTSHPVTWGENVAGVKARIKSKGKLLALTMDACGSTKGMKFDRTLIEFLEKEQVPATLFINGRWIEPNRKEFDRLAANPLFEIANHGLTHKPASINGRSVYGIQGTKNIAEVVDEIELNAVKIESLTGKRPKHYRSGTAYYDEVAVRIAGDLGQQVAGFSLLGDAGATYSRQQVKDALLSAKPGDIVILHFNHPESGTAGGVMDAIPELKKRGYRFVRLSDVELE
jgi:peptidoglycan/xylan/chitin deacetylase (PgdA/CDA1 family)